jgi:TRAP-type C4-dicarboxylate transport system permease small subunit
VSAHWSREGRNLSENISRRPGLFGMADRVLQPIENVAALIAGVMTVVAMLLTSLDATLRYTINAPLNFNYFLTEQYLMVGLICMPLAWAFRTGGYIRISFLAHALPPKVANMLLRVGLIASFLYVADLALLAAEEWYKLYEAGAVEMGVIDWPWHWSWIWVPIGLTLLALRLLLTAFGPAEDLDIVHNPEEEGV